MTTMDVSFGNIWFGQGSENRWGVGLDAVHLSVDGLLEARHVFGMLAFACEGPGLPTGGLTVGGFVPLPSVTDRFEGGAVTTLCDELMVIAAAVAEIRDAELDAAGVGNGLEALDIQGVLKADVRNDDVESAPQRLLDAGQKHAVRGGLATAENDALVVVHAAFLDDLGGSLVLAAAFASCAPPVHP